MLYVVRERGLSTDDKINLETVGNIAVKLSLRQWLSEQVTWSISSAGALYQWAIVTSRK